MPPTNPFLSDARLIVQELDSCSLPFVHSDDTIKAPENPRSRSSPRLGHQLTDPQWPVIDGSSTVSGHTHHQFYSESNRRSTRPYHGLTTKSPMIWNRPSVEPRCEPPTVVTGSWANDARPVPDRVDMRPNDMSEENQNSLQTHLELTSASSKLMEGMLRFGP